MLLPQNLVLSGIACPLIKSCVYPAVTAERSFMATSPQWGCCPPNARSNINDLVFMFITIVCLLSRRCASKRDRFTKGLQPFGQGWVCGRQSANHRRWVESHRTRQKASSLSPKACLPLKVAREIFNLENTFLRMIIIVIPSRMTPDKWRVFFLKSASSHLSWRDEEELCEGSSCLMSPRMI